MLGTILGLLVIGLVAGLLARAVVPGRDSMGILPTILLGCAGSFVGGFLGRLLLGRGDSLVQPSSWMMAVRSQAMPALGPSTTGGPGGSVP